MSTTSSGTTAQPRSLREKITSPFKDLQKVGKAFMLPIAILPAAGLLLGIGGALSNPNTVGAYPVLKNGILQAVFTVMADAGTTVFDNLPLLLSIGLCIGLAKRDKGTAALAGIVGYLVMTGTIDSLLKLTGGEEGKISTGIVGSLVVGAVGVWVHNRYHNIQLPQMLGFFGGSRFVPIAMALIAIPIGAFFFLTWPHFQQMLISTGKGIAGAGPLGTFLYGMLLRLSGAVGLHHVVYPMFWYTPLGGTEMVAGETVKGAQNIFFAQLADPGHAGLYTEGTKYFAGRFGTMMFGLPGACLAMYHCVPKERRKLFGSLFAGVALTSFLTGITEPIEYMFLFVAPLLYVFHAFLDGLSFLVADLLNIRIGNTFSGGAIDYTLFGVLQGQDKTNFLYVIPVGIAWFALYYFTFRFFIQKFNIATPGRTDEPVEGVRVPETGDAKASAQGAGGGLISESKTLIAALGGANNIDDVDACITRLRVSVHDPSLLNKATIKDVGAVDVFEVGNGGVQAVFGAKAVLYKNEINTLLGRDD